MINEIKNIDCLAGLKLLADSSVDCCVTSPPYFGLRDYGNSGQIGLEKTPELFVKKMVEVFTEVKRVLKKEGTLWLNLGDTYAAYYGDKYGQAQGLSGKRENIGNAPPSKKSFDFKNSMFKPKDLLGIPWMVAFALRSDGWYLRQDIIWSKQNCMPESVTDRCTKSHEYIFLLAKSAKYHYDNEAIKTKMDCPEHDKRTRASRKRKPTAIVNGIREGNDTVYEFANKRSVWETTLVPFAEAHFATFPQRLIIDCIKAGCPEGGIVLDPFMGAGTTALVASKLNRRFIGFELNPDYVKLANRRLKKELGMFLPNSEQNPERSDATDDDSSNTAG